MLWAAVTDVTPRGDGKRSLSGRYASNGRVARHGGRDAVIRKGGFGATPAPGEDPDYAVES